MQSPANPPQHWNRAKGAECANQVYVQDAVVDSRTRGDLHAAARNWGIACARKEKFARVTFLVAQDDHSGRTEPRQGAQQSGGIRQPLAQEALEPGCRFSQSRANDADSCE